ncbi:BLUF domain-containing protein [uncultured Thiodictyon sp.]|uniref:BLUF domain-containing protein n=1 Tax=uncultured Thiodictyon sp. TaxID=1846217 RepID=UPI0025FF51DC|nr:BLUF domain-containing protein [uncultured Thiodictyon sp.]
MALIHLIYVSTAFKELDTTALDQILASSVRHNTPQQVTGMLLYAGGSFMQVLEGEAAAVDETFTRIKRDPRHTDVFEIAREPVDERHFDRWSMGFKRLSAGDAATHPGYAPFFEHGFDPATIGAHPGLALEMLIDFSLNQSPGRPS